ncbi:MAG: arginine--tRNA ligase [Campylobacteraceae bacterium]
MKQKVIDTLKNHITCDFYLEKPKDMSLGHYATPLAFSLAKELKKSPMLIANELALKLKSEPIFEEVTAINGYINFKLTSSFMDEFVTNSLKNETDFAKGDKTGSYLIEYVSANPTGPLHIGHTRGAVIGDSLCSIGRHLGYTIKSEYYINDAGNQIDLLGLSIYLRAQELLFNDENVAWPEKYYRGEYITDIIYKAKEKFGEEIFKDEKNLNTLSEFGKDYMMIEIPHELEEININIQNYVSEKSLFPKWQETLKKLENNGKTYVQDGKIWLKSSDFGDEKDRVLVREDGVPTYIAGDIIYHDDKFSREFDHYINIWGADHHGYIARMMAAVNFLGYDEKKLEIILAQMVSLLKDGEPFKMSKRAGTSILMSDVVSEIGSDALRFMFLSKKCDTHLEFDVDALKQNDNSNPVYYINYAHARINQVFEKSGKTLQGVLSVKLENLNESATNLLFSALLLPEVLEDAFSSRQLQKVTDYLKNLASLLHKFYNENRVVGSEFEDIYLKLLSFVALSLRTGLKLIGIKAKDKM